MKNLTTWLKENEVPFDNIGMVVPRILVQIKSISIEQLEILMKVVNRECLTWDNNNVVLTIY